MLNSQFHLEYWSFLGVIKEGLSNQVFIEEGKSYSNRVTK